MFAYFRTILKLSIDIALTIGKPAIFAFNKPYDKNLLKICNLDTDPRWKDPRIKRHFEWPNIKCFR